MKQIMLWIVYLVAITTSTVSRVAAFVDPAYNRAPYYQSIGRMAPKTLTLHMTATVQQDSKDEIEDLKENASAPPTRKILYVTDADGMSHDSHRRQTIAGTASVLASISFFKEELGLLDLTASLQGNAVVGNMAASLTPEVLQGDTIVRSLWLNRLAYPVLIVALEIGLFEALRQGPLTKSDLGARTSPTLKGDGRALEAIVGVLSSLELVKFKSNNKNTVELTSAAKHVLLKDSPFFWGPQLMAADGITSSLRLAVHRDDKVSVKDYAGSHSVSQVNSFIDSMQAHGSVTAMATANALEPLICPTAVQPAKQVLDMAGGSGCFAKALQASCPHLKVVVADIPSVVARLRSQRTGKWWGSQVQAMPADLFTAETWPVGPDVHLLANVVHDWGKTQTMKILKASYQTLLESKNAGRTISGRLIIVEQLLNDDQSGPLAAALASVSMLLGDWRTGKQYSFKELEAMMTEVGFSSVELGPACGNFHTAVIGYV